MKILYAGKTKSPIMTYPNHFHRSWEILYSIDGRGDAWIDGNCVPFEKGTMMLLPPYTTHYKTSAEGYMDGSLMVSGLNIPDPEPITGNDDDAETGLRLFELILEAFYRGEEAQIMYESLIDALVSFLQGRVNISKKKNPAVERMEALLTEHISDTEFHLTESLNHTGYGRNYFRKLFADATGETPLHYLHRLRITFAKQEISRRQGYCRLQEIAALAGFTDPYYFSRVFKKMEGISPREYQHSVREEGILDHADLLEKSYHQHCEIDQMNFEENKKLEEWV